MIVRDQWYGDNRDVVKWATLVHLARTHHIDRVVQVAFYRPSEIALRLKIDSGEVPVPKEVIDHFRNIEQIQALARATGLHINVFKEPFQPDEGSLDTRIFRVHYIERVVTALSNFSDARLITFLDPDTGIAPRRAGGEHVEPREIRTIYDALKANDMLVFYQHAPRKQHWLENARRAFAEAVRVDEHEVNTVTCLEAARDVAFFAVYKTSGQ